MSEAITVDKAPSFGKPEESKEGATVHEKPNLGEKQD